MASGVSPHGSPKLDFGFLYDLKSPHIDSRIDAKQILSYETTKLLHDNISELVGAFALFAAKLKVIKELNEAHINKVINSSNESSGMLSCLVQFNESVSSTTKAAFSARKTISETSLPLLQSALDGLVPSKTQQTDPSKSARVSSNTTTAASSNSRSQSSARLEQKLAYAKKEEKDAQEFVDSISERFGKDVLPSLRTTAQARLEKAKQTVKAVESDLGIQQASPVRMKKQNVAQHQSLLYGDSAEIRRVDSAKVAFTSVCKGLASFVGDVAKNLPSFGNAIASLDAQNEMSSWVASVAKLQVPSSRHIPGISPLKNNEIRAFKLLACQESDSSASSQAGQQSEMIALQEKLRRAENRAMAAELQLSQNGDKHVSNSKTVKHQTPSRVRIADDKGGSTRSSKGKPLESTAVVEARGDLDVVQKEDLESPIAENAPPSRGDFPVRFAKKKQRLFRPEKLSDQNSKGPKFHVEDHIDNFWESTSSLSYPNPIERFIMVQNAYENFLLRLRNLDLAVEARGDSTWDSEDYYPGPLQEDGTAAIPLSLPMNIGIKSEDISQPFALEWGASFMDEKQWKCLSYETLLLVFHTLHSNMTNVRASEARYRGIDGLDAQLFEEPDSFINVRFQYGPTTVRLEGETEEKIFSNEDNYFVVRRLLALTRIKLQITGHENSAILQLMLPGSSHTCISLGEWTAIHPLDVRYRISRLIDSWIRAGLPLDGTSEPLRKNVQAKCWIKRQLHTINVSLSFKLDRLQKFVDRDQGQFDLSWLNEDWIQRTVTLETRIPRFSKEDNKHFGGKLLKLQCLIEKGITYLKLLYDICDENKWGIGSEGQSIKMLMRLLQIMAIVESMDNAIRKNISDDETGVLNTFNKEDSAREKNKIPEDESDASSDISLDIVLPSTEEDIENLFNIVPQPVMSIFWSYEVPFLQVVFSHIWLACIDSSSNNGLQDKTPTLVQSIILAGCMAQQGVDITRYSDDIHPLVAPITLDTHAILLSRGLWNQVVNPSEDTLDSFLDDKPENANAISVISSEACKTILDVMSNFSSWVEPKSPELSFVENEKTKRSGHELLATSVFHRVEKLLSFCPPSLEDSLSMPKDTLQVLYILNSENPTWSPDKWWLVPDFSVVDLEVFQKPVSKLPKIFAEIRVEPEGLFLSCPSRVERVVSELIIRRSLAAPMRQSLYECLKDYRLRFDPESLLLGIKCWDAIGGMLVLNKIPTPACPYMESEDYEFSKTREKLSSVLTGPHYSTDMYRHFVYSTACAMYKRVFANALEMIRHNPVIASKDRDSDMPEEDRQKMDAECGEVVKEFANAFETFLGELRGEIEHYTIPWANLLPGNQHAVIWMVTTRQNLISGIQLLINSPFWPTDDFPPYGTDVLRFMSLFEYLNSEVRTGTLINYTEKPDLRQGVASFLSKAFTRGILLRRAELQRAISSDSWIPAAPPDKLHSKGIVDMFSFARLMIEPMHQTLLPDTFTSVPFNAFLGTLIDVYMEESDVAFGWNPQLDDLCGRSDFIFNRLYAPIARADVVAGAFGTFLDEKKKKKKQGGYFSGLKWKTEKKNVRPVDPQPNLSENEASKYPESENSVPGDKDKKKKKKEETKKEEIKIPPQLKELSGVIGPELTMLLHKSLETSRTQNLLGFHVKLHSLQFFMDQYNLLIEQYVSHHKELRYRRDASAGSIRTVIMSASRIGKVGHSTVDETDSVAEDLQPYVVNEELPADDDYILELRDALQKTKNKMVDEVMKCAHGFCKATARRIIYVELGRDIFEDLYRPSFGEQTLEMVIAAFEVTVDRFVDAAPELLRPLLTKNIVVELAKAWMLLLTEMGYKGLLFQSSVMRVLDDDLEAFRIMTQEKGMSDLNVWIEPPEEIDDEEAEHVGGRGVNLVNYLNDFFVFVAKKPLLLAQLGGLTVTSIPEKSPQGSTDIFKAPAEAVLDVTPVGVKKKKKGMMGKVKKLWGATGDQKSADDASKMGPPSQPSATPEFLW
eukprot:GHVP01066884.1.p1 GENE.GHVP01066884.1~~GHVP01066884.1.p1  ORF type:complete len:1982 (+),score=337.68 GHVP01066884.1:2142-8087(+)